MDSSHFHALLPCEDGGGGFAAALLPLQEGIPLLERQVDIVALERIQVDVSMILGVPILKATDPVSKLRVFGHLGKGLLLIVILPAFPAQHPLIAGKPFRLIVQHCLIDRNRRTHLVRQELCRFPAVCLVDKAVFLLDQTNFIPLRLGVLAAQSLLQIRQHLCFGKLHALPLLIGHIRRLPLGIKAVNVGKAGVVFFPRDRMASDLIQVLLHLIEKSALGGFELCQFQKDFVPIACQLRLCDHDKLLVKRGRCHDRMPGGNIDVRAVRRVPFGCPVRRGAFLLPELQFGRKAVHTAV